MHSPDSECILDAQLSNELYQCRITDRECPVYESDSGSVSISSTLPTAVDTHNIFKTSS